MNELWAACRRLALEDPELFWRDQRGVTILDEVHRLANLVVTLRQAQPYTRRHGDLEVRYVPFDQLAPILDELR